MVCIYCSSKTQVANSRHQKRVNHNWRRRECLSCHAVFTTIERTDYKTSLVVKQSDAAGHHLVVPFSRDALFVSILKAVGHRQTAIDDAGALTATIIAKLLGSTTDAAIRTDDIASRVLETLRLFDTAAATQYEAYHKG